MIYHAQIHVDLRAQATEAIEDLRHPVHGDACVGRDPYDLGFFLRHRADLVFQIGVCLQKFPNRRHQLSALFRQLYAAVAPLQQGKADLPFQRVHHMGQAGLSIADDLGGLGKAAQVGCRHQDFKFFAVHGAVPFYAHL